VVLVKRKWQHKNTTKFNSEASTSTNVVFSASDVPVLYPSQAYVEDELTGLPARLELICVVQVTFYIVNLPCFLIGPVAVPKIEENRILFLCARIFRLSRIFTKVTLKFREIRNIIRKKGLISRNF